MPVPTLKFGSDVLRAKTIVAPPTEALAPWIASRSEPGPESLVVVTGMNEELFGPFASANGEVLLATFEVAIAVGLEAGDRVVRVEVKEPSPLLLVVTVPVPRNVRACTPVAGSAGPLA